MGRLSIRLKVREDAAMSCSDLVTVHESLMSNDVVYVTKICSGHRHCATLTKVVGWIPDRVSHAKFYQNRFRGFGLNEGQILLFVCA